MKRRYRQCSLGYARCLLHAVPDRQHWIAQNTGQADGEPSLRID